MPNTNGDPARTIVIPLANPTTAPVLLKLAKALASKKGRIIALQVMTGEGEEEHTPLEEVEPIVEEFKKQNGLVELMVVKSTGVSRGILDVVREQRADLLILGVKKPIRNQVEMGVIAENVITTAPCDVLVYRDASEHDIHRVVVWANGSAAAQAAGQVGVLLAQNFQADLEAVLVQGRDRSQAQGLSRIEESLAGIPGSDIAKRTVITAGKTIPGLLSRITDDDLLVVGFPRRSELEKWLFGDFSRHLLNHAPGPVVLLARSDEETTLIQRLTQQIRWAVPTITPAEQDDLFRQAQESAYSTLDYVVLIIVSAVIACLGLLLNSAAVIIGAMLIAPLMQPLMALSTGMATGQLLLIQRVLTTLLTGIVLAVAVSALAGWLMPLDIPTQEMLSRGSPTLIDAGVAFAAGFIGAYATVRRGVSSAVAGVAIAAALMPPLCTVGLGFAFGEEDLALGALLLFLTNIGFIILSGWAVYFWVGVRPRPEETADHFISNRHRYTSLAVVVFLMIPIVYAVYSLSSQASTSKVVKDHLQDFFPRSEVRQVELRTEESPMRVVAVLRSVSDPGLTEVRLAEELLEEELNREINLEIVVERLIRPIQPLKPED